MLAYRTALLLASAVLLAMMALACGGGDPAYRSFRLEATSEVLVPALDDDEPLVSEIAWWYEPPGRWRWEIANDLGAFVSVSDGERWWFYDSVERTYTVERLPEGLDAPFLPISPQIGPAHEASIDEFIETLAFRVDGWAKRSGEERLLGREVVIIEYGPIEWSSDSDGRERAWGEGRIAIDPETMFILRHEISGEPGANAVVTVTRLEIGVDLPDERFEFEPPDGARHVEE